MSILLVPLLLWVSGCWLFNVPPIAAFTASTHAGQAPLTVHFSALPSEDPDGDITEWSWTFGDGTSKLGETVSNTYEAEGSFVVVLRVTDDDGETATASKTIYVSPAAPPGPSASFTATPTLGNSPLNVIVDAAASSYDAGAISHYEWDWGDGSLLGSGRVAGHSYYTGVTRTYTVTLTVHGSDGKTGTYTRTVTATVAGSTTPTANAPSARFTISHNDNTQTDSVVVYANHVVAPLQTWFDPSTSEAVDGRTIASYTWTFGDGNSMHTLNSSLMKHVYRTDQVSETFSVTLVVIDDAGSVDSVTKTVKVYNYQPTAGFEIYTELGPNLIDSETLASTQDEMATGGNWTNADATVTFTEVQTDSTTVWIRSLPPTLGDPDTVPTSWVGDPDPANEVETKGTATAEPSNFDDDAGKADLCFDPEGQGWDHTVPYDKTAKPDGWTNTSWGIERIEIDWDDNTTQNYDYYDWVMDGDGTFMHEYAPPGDTTAQYTITVTAHDFLGAQASFSRTITLKVGE